MVAIEGREANAAKARVAAEVLGLERLEIRVEDVRELSAERHGTFDVVLCLGLLYHLDADDLFPFIDTARRCLRLTADPGHACRPQPAGGAPA